MTRVLAAALAAAAFALPSAAQDRWDKSAPDRARALLKKYFAASDRAAVERELAELGPIPVKEISALAEEAYALASQGPRLALQGGQAAFEWKGERLAVLVNAQGAAGWTRRAWNGGAPVLIGLHGGAPGVTGNAGLAAGQWGAASSKGAITIFPNQPSNAQEAWTSEGGVAYVRTILETVKRTYHVDTNRIYLAGHSFGGFGTMHQGCTQADRWAAISPNAFIPYPDNPVENLKNTPISLYWGLDDEKIKAEGGEKHWKDLDARLAALRKEHGPYDYALAAHNGIGHGGPPGGFGPIVNWLFSKTRDPYPKKVVVKQARSSKSRMYWVDAPPGRLVVAEWAKNRISVTVEGSAGGVTVLLSDKMADFSKPVTVTVNGEEVFNGHVSPSLAVLARTMADTVDLRQFFVSEIPCHPR
jgi:hypothetical protein